ncbi:MAG: CPBP family intramembrane metalloprotease [Oscillospiraceae bacterium]|nr:CPBP family intramembrane metalloprotease [Oscillospiraceae bacterium]
MDDQKERPEAPVAEEAAADQETLARSIQEDERQDLLDEKVADTLRSCDREKKLSGGAAPEEAVREEIVQQTIDAEEMQETLDTRVLRDFDEGIVTMDRRGIIRYINPAASMILGLTDNAVGKLYREVFGKENDALLDFLADATLEKNTSQRGDILYRREDGSRVRLDTSCICLQDEEDSREISYAIHFEDITEIDALRRKRRESSAVFIGTMTAVSVWIFLVALWQQTGQRISQELMTQCIHAIALIMFFYIRHYTHFTFEEMGLKIKGISGAVKADCLLTAVFAAVLFGLKLVLLRVSPGFFDEGAPFWDWSRLNWSDILYPLTVVLQEFLSRGVIHENLRRIFVGKHSEAMAIVVSSLIFGALHIHRGFIYMIAATALLSIFGVLYRRQNSIWGLCIPHFVLGEIIWFLGYV